MKTVKEYSSPIISGSRMKSPVITAITVHLILKMNIMDNYMHKDIESVEELEKFISDNPGAVVYFSTLTCNVCKVLKPKLIELLELKFPLMTFAYVDCDKSKELAAQNNIFAVPTVLFFMDGKEIIRKSRNLSLTELEGEINRPYSLFFS